MSASDWSRGFSLTWHALIGWNTLSAIQPIEQSVFRGKLEGRVTGVGLVGSRNYYGNIVEEGGYIRRVGKRSVERDTTKGGRKRGGWVSKVRLKCTRAAKKRGKEVLGAPESGGVRKEQRMAREVAEEERRAEERALASDEEEEQQAWRGGEGGG
ncbi:hypothetical protein Syun_025623 [Stephania yunnanensis]|uniref:Uncharacterized protein n=1 Tax=Stephania yunnanensis TaxID=152371 RepID=A0AAP0HRF3_9MAGN